MNSSIFTAGTSVLETGAHGIDNDINRIDKTYGEITCNLLQGIMEKPLRLHTRLYDDIGQFHFFRNRKAAVSDLTHIYGTVADVF